MESSVKSSLWASIALGSFSAISALIGSNIKGFAWLLYLCGITLTISVAILLWDRFLNTTFKHYRSKQKAIKCLKENFPRYHKIIEKFQVLEEMERALSTDKIEWNSQRPDLFGSTQNSLHNLKQVLENVPIEYRLISSNVALGEIVKSFDGWLKACDRMLKTGNAKYKTEDTRNEFLSLLTKYHNLTSTHDELCREINSNLKYNNLNLMGFFCKTHGFNWKKSEPQAQKADAY